MIESDVEIGANCTIDRGVSADTKIGQGSKLDNLIHVAHEVIIGKNCLIAAQVGIAGATRIGNGVILWGQVGVTKTIEIGDDAVIMSKSAVLNNLNGAEVYWGIPAQIALSKRKELVWIKRIPEIWERVKNLPPSPKEE